MHARSAAASSLDYNADPDDDNDDVGCRISADDNDTDSNLINDGDVKDDGEDNGGGDDDFVGLDVGAGAGDGIAQCVLCTVEFPWSKNSPGDATKLPSIRHRFWGIICISPGK